MEVGSPHPFTRIQGLALVGALLVFVGIRVVLCVLQPLEVYQNEEYPQLRMAAAVWGDQAAWEGYLPEPRAELLDPDRPFRVTDFMYAPSEGSTLVMSILLVPLAGLLGFGAASVKAAAIGWHLLVVLAWVAVVRRLLGSRAAVGAAWIFALGTVPWIWVTSILHGYHHAQGALFLPLALLALFRSSCDGPRRAAVWAAIAGCVMGFATWFSILNTIPLAVLTALVPLLCRRGRLLLIPFLLGAAVGALPWLATFGAIPGFGAREWSVADALSMLTTDDPDHRWFPFASLWTAPRFTSLDIGPTGAGRVPLLEAATRATLLAGLALAIARARALHRDSNPTGRLLALTALAAFASYAGLVEFLSICELTEAGQRRVTPVLPATLALIALAAAGGQSRPRLGRVALVWVVLLMLAHAWLGLASVLVDKRPEGEFRPWLVYAPPTPDIRDRHAAGIAGVDRSQVAALDRSLHLLLANSESFGEIEIRGLATAFRAGWPVCEGNDAPDLWFGDPREVYAFGAGLAIQCERKWQAVAACQQVQPEWREACNEGVELMTSAP